MFTPELRRCMEAARRAREREALAVGVMFDYIDYRPRFFWQKTVRMWRPSFAHGWVIAKLNNCASFSVSAEELTVCAYALTFDSEAVRNGFSRRIDMDRVGLLEEAKRFFRRHERRRFDLLAIAQVLLLDLVPEVAPGTRTALADFWWSAAIGQLAAAYGWSEREIFALPLVRYRAFLDEIAISAGADVARYYRELPEETALREVETAYFEGKMKNGGQQL